MRARNFLIALPFAALAIAGCGGGDGGEETTSAPAVATTPTTTALSKEELISQGDAICAEVNAALAAVSSNTASSESQVSQVADLYIGMVDSLQGLGTPDDTAGYDEVMSAGDDLAQAESDAKLADERGDSAALSTAQTEATSATIAFQSAAQSYGFDDCGQGPGVSATSTSTAPSSGTATTPTTTTPTTPSTTPATPAPAPAPNTGGAGGGTAGTAPAAPSGGSGGGSTGGASGGIGPG